MVNQTLLILGGQTPDCLFLISAEFGDETLFPNESLISVNWGLPFQTAI